MGQVGGGLGFATKALYERLVGCVVGVQHLHSHPPAQHFIAGRVDVGHSSTGKVVVEPIAIGEQGGVHLRHE